MTTCSTGRGSDVHRREADAPQVRGFASLAPSRRQSRHGASPGLSRVRCRKRPGNEGSPASSYLDGPQGVSHPVKDRLANSSPAPEPGQPSPAVVAERRVWLLLRVVGYLRDGDAALRNHAAEWLAFLQRRHRGCA